MNNYMYYIYNYAKEMCTWGNLHRKRDIDIPRFTIIGRGVFHLSTYEGTIACVQYNHL
jgi:hypothetical protein